MERLVYGYWDCSQCGSTGIRGDIRECPNCGKPRGSDTKFYMSENVEYVPAKAENTISRNPDWLCSYCNSLNSDTLNECKGCGASKSASEQNYFDLHKQNSPDEEPSCDYTEKFNGKIENILQWFDNKLQWFENNNIVKNIVYIAAAIAVIFFMIFLFKTHTKEMTVSGFEWTRSIDIQKFETFDESDWSLPSTARLKYSDTEFKEYEDVFDHYETRTRQVQKERLAGYETYVSGYRDLGNGMFEEITAQRPVYETYYETETYQEPIYRQEPVYATRYYYEIDRWIDERIIRTSGTNKKPVWGNTETLTDKERVSDKHEKYQVLLINDENETVTTDIDFNLWNSLSYGDTVTAKVNCFGKIVSIEFPTGELMEDK